MNSEEFNEIVNAKRYCAKCGNFDICNYKKRFHVTRCSRFINIEDKLIVNARQKMLLKDIDPFENISDEELEQYSMEDILKAVIAAQVINKSVEGEDDE